MRRAKDLVARICPAFPLLIGLWILALSPSRANAEADTLGVISGSVVSAKDGSAIQNVSAIVLGKSLGAPTNRAGQFRINRVPPGPQILRVMILGFKRVDRKVAVLPGENAVGTISLEAEVVRIAATECPMTTRSGGVGSHVAGARLECAVRLVDPEPTVGDPVEIEARIYNLSESEVALPVGRDGAEGVQFPRILVRIDGPTDGFVAEPEDRRDGRPLREKDFVTVRHGGTFDPFIRGWRPSNLTMGRIKKPGKYRLVFQYSTRESDVDQWMGDTRFMASSAAIVERLRHVPLAELADSVSFVVRE